MGTRQVIDTKRLDLSVINILEFERRVKKFAHPCNAGKVSIAQLKEAFRGTGIFNQLGNRKSLAHIIICSPFFKSFAMTHLAKNEDWFEAQGELVLSGVQLESKTGHREIPHTTELEQATIVVDALLLYGCVYCQGRHVEKAAVFHRIVAPEFSDIISITDKDLKTAFVFMISLATVIEQMILEYISDPEIKINYKFY